MIITLAQSKGGVGKSTTCACLAGAVLAAGQTVHIVDLDTNQTISRWMTGANAKRLTIAKPAPRQLTAHLEEIARTKSPDLILIDLAGAFEEAITVATARANLTLIPAAPTEADLHEASRVVAHVRNIFAAFNREPLVRVLLTKVQSLASHVQNHAFNEVKRLDLPCFETALTHRAAYQEIGFSGAPPHLASPPRPTTQKAVAEVDARWRETGDLIANQTERKIAA